MRQYRKYIARVLIVALIFSTTYLFRGKDMPIIEHAKAGDITSPTWSLSSTTLGATNVTYTHTFQIATALPANTGRVEIQFDTMTGPPPAFWASTLGSNTTAALRSQRIEIYPEGPGVLTLAIQNGSTAIPKDTTVTLEFTGMTNPSTGGSFSTNTYTLNNGTALDGQKGPNYNASLSVGSVTLTVNASYGGNPVAGYPFEVHPQNGGSLWRANTNASGDAKFYGVPDGTYVLETSHAVDPNSDTAKNVLAVYMQIEPRNITLPSGGPINIVLNRSNKIISVTVKYSDTGAAIQGANVNSFSTGGGGFAYGQTNGNGVAELRVSASGDKANMMITVGPPFGPGPGGGQQADFVAKPAVPVTFNLPANEPETISLEILVDRPDATVTGKILNPDGSAATGGIGAENFRTHTFQPVMVNPSTGSFSFSTSAGTGEWELHRFDPSGQYMMPKTKFSVKQGANDIGTIRLVVPDGSINVAAYRVDSGSDVALANTPIMAFNTKNPGPPIMSVTGADGTAKLKVMKGQKYRVMANPGGSGPGMREGGGEGEKKMGLLQWTASANAQEMQSPMGSMDANQLFPVTAPQIGSDGASLTFKFDKATKKLTITTVDSNGNLVSDGNWINVRPSGSGGPQFGPGFGGPGAGGMATVYTTAGTFMLNAFYPPDSQYTGKEKEITVSGDTAVQLVVVKKTATITGQILDSSNNNALISGANAKKLNLMVGAFWKGGFSGGYVNAESGTYSVKIPPSVDVNVGVAPGDALMGGKSDYVPSLSPQTFSVADGQTETYNLTLAKVDAVISVTVKDQDGKAIEGVTVSASNRLADIVGPAGPGGPGERRDAPEGPEFGFSGVTGSDGKATINVAPDTYNLVTNARDRGLFATETTSVAIASKETKEVTINLVKADATMEVDVNKSDGSHLNESSVQVFNDSGTIAFKVTDGSEEDKDGAVNGRVAFDLPSNKGGDAYTIKAGKDNPEDGSVNESDFVKAVLDKNEVEQLTLGTETEVNALAASVTSDVSSASPATLQLMKTGTVEASLDIPTGALSSSSGQGGEGGGSSSATVTIVPLKAEANNTVDSKVVKGDSVEAIDGTGNSITSLSGQVAGSIHYNDSDIPPGAKESSFTVKSFNENSGQWETVAASNCDATTNTCTFATTHLTDFAVVTSSDTTSPSAPTNISATAGKQKATLAWTNPTDSDFAGIKIYRSTTAGTIGDLVTTISNKTTTSYENAGLTNGVTYFYTVRSYDTSGNISVNTTQVSATPGVLPLTGMESWPMRVWLKAVNYLSNLF